jgi:hypothetical protein
MKVASRPKAAIDNLYCEKQYRAGQKSQGIHYRPLLKDDLIRYWIVDPISRATLR